MQGLGEVPEGSGADTQVRFRKVPVQMRRSGSGRFRCRYLGEVPEGDAEVRFRKIPVQRLGEVPEGSGAYTQVR